MYDIGIYNKRQVPYPDRIVEMENYGWLEYTEKRVSRIFRPNICEVIRKQGFELNFYMITKKITHMSRSQNKARISYNRMSRWYDFFAGSSEHKFMNLGISLLRPRPGDRILEIGCGTGHGLISLARMVSNSGLVNGLDISERMLSRSKDLILKSEYPNSIHLQIGDGCHLPYASNLFTAIFLCFTLELFDTPDIPLVLGECWRVLNQKGRIIIVCLEKLDSTPVKIYEWFHRTMPSFIDCRPINVQIYLSQASFEITDSSSKSIWGLPVELVSAKKLIL